MKHKLLIAAAASAMLAAPSFAAAQDMADGQGWYLKGNIGYGQHHDADITGGVVGDVESEGGLTYNAGLGYDFGENWRLELDGTSMFSDMGSIAQQPDSFAKLRTDALMLNAIYDFTDFGRWAPYVGAGVGIVRSDISISAHDFLNDAGNVLVRNPACNPTDTRNIPASSYSCDIQDKGTGFGYQLLAGLGYDITDNLTWDTSYRYMDGPDVELDGFYESSIPSYTIPFGNGTQLIEAGNAQLQSNFDSVGAHQVLTGFRYRFGGPAKVMPTVVAPVEVLPEYQCWDGSMVFNAGQCPAEVVEYVEPEIVYTTCWDGSTVADATTCPAQPPLVTCWDGTFTYDEASCPLTPNGNSTADLCGEQYRQEIIYYEFNKGASAETRNTINRILDAGQYCDVQNIRVVGHTDTSGAASYNLALSKRRAADALNELVRQGVSRNVITSEGKGETEPFVQTGDGVKEQLNRRTEVLITLGSVGVMN